MSYLRKRTFHVGTATRIFIYLIDCWKWPFRLACVQPYYLLLAEMDHTLLKESSMQFCMHFLDACKLQWTINTTVIRVAWLSSLLYHVPAMCNATLYDTHATLIQKQYIIVILPYVRSRGIVWVWGSTRNNISLKVWHVEWVFT